MRNAAGRVERILASAALVEEPNGVIGYCVRGVEVRIGWSEGMQDGVVIAPGTYVTVTIGFASRFRFTISAVARVEVVAAPAQQTPVSFETTRDRSTLWAFAIVPLTRRQCPVASQLEHLGDGDVVSRVERSAIPFFGDLSGIEPGEERCP